MSDTAPIELGARSRRPPTIFGIVTTGTLVVCLVLFVWPVVMIVLGAFREGYPGAATGWTLDPIMQVFTSAENGSAMSTSFLLATIVTIVAKALSFYFAWMVARTNTPLRNLVTPVMLVVMALPPLFFVLSWALLGQVNVGMLNQMISLFTGEPSTLINSSTFAGVIFVSILKSIAFGYFLLLGPFRAMSHRMEEAAAVSGAGRLKTFWTINVPLMVPALGAALIMGFVHGLEYFEAPLILGTPTGVDVISTQIYSYLNDDYPPKFAQASGLAMIVLAILVVLLVFQGLLQRRRSFETIGGKSGGDRPWDLGVWKWAGTIIFVGYAFLAVVLPATQLIIASLQPYFGATSGYTLSHYINLFNNPRAAAALQTTALLGILSGLAVMVIALSVVFVVRNGNKKIGAFISRTTWLPLSMPGTALALGLLWVILSFPPARTLYGTFGAMFLGLIIVAMPIAMRNLEPAVMQVSDDLEEAAWVSGASRLRAFNDIVFRLILPSFLSGWLMSGILIGGNLVIPLLIGSPLLDTVPRMTFDLYTSGQGPAASALSCVFLAGILGIFLLGLLVRAVLGRLLNDIQPPVGALNDKSSAVATYPNAPATTPGVSPSSIHSAEFGEKENTHV